MNTNLADQEQRRFTRVPFVNGVTLTSNGQSWQGTVVDISFNGVLINCKEFSEETSSIIGEINFESNLTITAELKLVHHNANLYGFCFEDIDTDSVGHLRRLLTLNMGSESTCERELIALFRYHQ